MSLLIKTYLVYLLMLFSLIFLISLIMILMVWMGWLQPLVSGFDGIPDSLEFVCVQAVVIASLAFGAVLAILKFKKRVHFAIPWIVACVLLAVAATISAIQMTNLVGEGYDGATEYYMAGESLSVWWHVAAIAVPVVIGFIYHWLGPVHHTKNERTPK